MIRTLFARLTGEPQRGRALFGLAVSEARRPGWFKQGQVPDTVTGRFAVLATVIALIVVWLERKGTDGEQASVALTERLVETLDTEIREMGVGDPTVGKQVRKLVGSVSGRVGRWRQLVDSDRPWSEEARESLYPGETADVAALTFSETELRQLSRRLRDSGVAELVEGRMG